MSSKNNALQSIRSWAEGRESDFTTLQSDEGFTIALCWNEDEFVKYSKCDHIVNALFEAARAMTANVSDDEVEFVLSETYLRFVAMGRVNFSFYQDPSGCPAAIRLVFKFDGDAPAIVDGGCFFLRNCFACFACLA